MLAYELIERFHDKESADNAHKSAGNRLADGELPVDLPEVSISLDGMDKIFIAQVLNQANLVKNSAAAKDALKTARLKWTDRWLGRILLWQRANGGGAGGQKAFARVSMV